MNLFFILKNYVGVTVGVGVVVEVTVGVFVGVLVGVGVFVAVIVGVGVGVTHNENTPFIVPLANNSITTWS